MKHKSTLNRRPLLETSLGLGCVLAASLSATNAAPLYWDGLSSGWEVLGNWSTDAAATTPDPAAVPVAADDVFFNIDPVDGPVTVNLNAARAVRSLNFNNTGTTLLQGGTATQTLAIGAGGISVDAAAGAVTIGSATAVNVSLSASQTWMNNSATAVILGTPYTAAAGINLTKTGPGNFYMANTANTTNIGGLLDVQAGKILTAGDLTAGQISGAGNIENGGAASKWMFAGNATDATFGGNITGNPAVAAARLGLVKRGTGTLTLAGTNVLEDRLVVENGTLKITGNTIGGFAAGDGNRTVIAGTIANQNGRILVEGGTLNAARTASPALATSSIANSSGFIKMTSGTITTGSEFHIGRGTAGSFGAYTQTGGALTVASWIAVGLNNDRSIMNQSGGSIQVNTNRMTIGAGGNASVGVSNHSGGTFNVNAGANTGLFIGENGTGTLNVSGTAAITLLTNGAVNSGTLQFAGNATSLAGTVNLLGGSLSTFGVTKGASTGGAAAYQLNFNGGTLKAAANNPVFFNDIAAEAYVHAGGGTIDNGGFNIGVAEPLLAPPGGGVSAIGLTVSGGGYLDTPMVVLTGGDGQGATAAAVIDASGNLTGIVMTNPGINYTTPPAFSLVGGGLGNTGLISGAATIVANTSGGMTFTGTGIGTTTVTGVNTFTGPITVTGGRLAMSGSQPQIINVSSGGSITAAGAAGLLSVSNLTLANGSNAAFELSTPNLNNDQIEVTTPGTGLSLGTVGITLYEEGTTTSFTTLGTYTLFKYTTGFTGSLAGLSVANPILGYTYTFAATGSEITVTLASSDTDGDGLPNAWEIANGLNPNDASGVNGAGGNLDGDFATNLEEFLGGTAANNPASDPLNVDNDGMLDSWEVTNFGNIAARDGTGDYDGDIATDLAEFKASTNPKGAERTNPADWPDMDGDQINDAWELKYFPSLAAKDGLVDSDGDGISDFNEFLAMTSPVDAAWTPENSKIMHRWSFNNSLADSIPSVITGPDQYVNSPAVIVDPNGATASSAVTLGATDVSLAGGANGTSDYVSLGSNLLTGRAVPVTLEFWATQQTVQNWSRIFDFGSSNTEYILMSWTNGTAYDTVRMEFRDFVDTLQSPAGRPYLLNNEYHIVVTFEPGVEAGGLNRVSFYTAATAAPDLGAPRVTFATENNLVNLTDTLDALGRSQFTGDNTANARYNDVRFWHGSLALNQREKLHDVGPDTIDLTDSDGDGLVDAWELAYFPSLATTNGTVDSDLDGFDNAAEQAGRSIPAGTGALASIPADRDADGLADDWEALNFGNLAQTGTGDPDGDLATNEQEETALTNPTSAASFPDSDGDLLPDAWEGLYFGDLDIDNTGSDIDDGEADFDTDGFSDRVEFQSGSNPILATSHPLVLVSLPATGTDAASGISSSKTYTHAIDIGATVTAVSVNGVAFHQASIPAAGTDGTNNDRWVSADTTGGRNAPFTIDKSVAFDWAQNNANVANIGADGNMLALLTDFSNMSGSAAQLPIGTSSQTWTLGGLTPGTAYSVRLYYRPWTLVGTRSQRITINGDGNNVTSIVNPDESAVPFAGYVQYDYIANDTDISMTFALDNTTGASWHQHAITNEVVPAGDSDNDKLPDVWEIANFGNIAAQTGTGDADLDGTNNRSEYLLGLSPVNSAERFSATQSNVSPGTGATLTWPAQTGLTFTVWRSTTLSGTWTQLGGTITASGATASYTDNTAPAGRAFYRINLTTP